MKRTKHLSLLIAPILLSAVMGCSRSNPESTSEVVADAVVTAKVKAALVKDQSLKAVDIKVQTNGGEVQLSGTADSKTDADRAAEVAKQVEGVKAVKNELVVKAA